MLQEDQVLELLYVSKKYMIQTLTVKCCEFLGQSIDAENFCTILDHSISCDVEGLQNKSLVFIEENIEEVIEKENFLDLSYGSLLCIVKSDKLCIAELGLIQAVMRWADAQCERQQMESSKDNRRSVLKDIMYQLRFASLTPETFVRFNDKFNVLNSEEMIQIFNRKFLPAVKQNTMPITTNARKSNVKILDIIEPHQTYSTVIQAESNITIRCNKDIMIHAIRLSNAWYHCRSRSPDSQKATCTATVNGQHSSGVISDMENMVKFGKPIPIKGKTIQIQTKFNRDCQHRIPSLVFKHPCYIQTNVYPLKSEIRDRGVTFTCPEGASPLMGIEYARYYE